VRREAIVCPDLPRPIMGSHAVRAGDFVFLGGQLATDYRTGLVPEVETPRAARNAVVAAKLQSEYILRATETILRAAGSSLRSGTRIDQFVTRPEVASPYLEVRLNHVDMSIRPASTHIQLREFLLPRALVTLELIGVTDRLGAQKEMIFIEEMPKSPAGPFKGAPQGVKAGGFVFLTGQIASDFKTGVAPRLAPTPPSGTVLPSSCRRPTCCDSSARCSRRRGARSGTWCGPTSI
jgi:enamine deaminase RidA (YjgF/YER057c/UK114 family)